MRSGLLALWAALVAWGFMGTHSWAAPPTRGDVSMGTLYAQWPAVLGEKEDFFPIAVWLQDPRHAGRYREIGVNLYVGLWKGPTEAQLQGLKQAGMPVICSQNQVGLTSRNNDMIVGWLQEDEPDNAQRREDGRGYGPPITPQVIQERYQAMRRADPTRPVMLNLGQGVAWDGWYGRGVRTHHPEDYAEYIRGGDIISFDIYPVVSTDRDVAGQLWRIPFGVDRLREWAGGRKVTWHCVETTHIGNPHAKATPQQVRSEIWMGIINGSQGIIYFVHQFKPRFIEAGLLADDEMTAAVAQINKTLTQLARVLNSPTQHHRLTLGWSNEAVPLRALVKEHGGATYVFAAAQREGSTRGSFMLRGIQGPATVTVIDENRTIQAENGKWSDDFGPYAVHLYKVEHPKR